MKRGIVFATLLLAVGFALTTLATGADDDVAGVRASCEAIVTAWNKHDAKSVAAVFAPDADMITPDGRLVSGRAEIEKAFAEDYTGALKESTLRIMKEPVRFPVPEVAVSDAEVELTGVVGPDGAKAPPMTMIVTNVWKKTDGKWWVYASRPRVKSPPK